jgi:hypothetical protein
VQELLSVLPEMLQVPPEAAMQELRVLKLPTLQLPLLASHDFVSVWAASSQ